jgi:hypothetical protein
MNMAVKLAFLGRVPGAEPTKHRCVIETPYYMLFAVMVKDQEQAIEACKTLVNEEGIDQITLCPAFTHRDVGEIAGVVGENIAVAVARRDGRSNEIMTRAKKREGVV